MILIIDNNKRTARNLADMFLYMGFLAYCASETDAVEELSPPYRAIVFSTPGSIEAIDELVCKIRAAASATPIFAICDNISPQDARIFDRIIERGCYASEIAYKIIEFADGHGLSTPGSYEYCGIDVSADLCVPTYNGTPLPFTKTECMILRYLIASAPHAASAYQILERAYRPSRTPDVSNIRTHVSVINKKFRELTGHSLITQSMGEGYRIDPH